MSEDEKKALLDELEKRSGPVSLHGRYGRLYES